MLVYVDPNGVQQIANNLLFSERSSSFQGGVTIGVPMVNFELKQEFSSMQQISSLMPETLAESVYAKLKPQEVKETIDVIRLVDKNGKRKILPGSALLLTGTIKFMDRFDTKDFNPLEPDPISVKQYRLHGEDVFVASVFDDPFFIPVYFPFVAKEQVPYSNGQDVSVLGVCKWVPPYRPGSGSFIELALRASAMWIN